MKRRKHIRKNTTLNWEVIGFADGSFSRALNLKLIASVPIAFVLGTSPTTAEGPDYFRLLTGDEQYGLTIYSEPTKCSQSVGQILAGTNKIRNYGCKGGLEFDEWIAASSAEREESRRKIWCEIEYAGVRGWVRGLNLVEDN